MLGFTLSVVLSMGFDRCNYTHRYSIIQKSFIALNPPVLHPFIPPPFPLFLDVEIK